MNEITHTHFDFAQLTARERYKLLIGTVIPRPIAFVTTVGRNGQFNAAPFSFFNVLSQDPAIVAIGVENHADMSFKDTARNVRETEVFTVNMVDDALAQAMEVCAVKFAPDVDELQQAGLTPVAGTHVASPRILQAPASLECKRYMTLELGRAREIILGEVVGVFIRSDLVDERLHVDQIGFDAIGRLGGHGYARTRDQFDIKTMTVEQWEARKAAAPSETGDLTQAR